MHKLLGVCVMIFTSLTVANESEFTDLSSSSHAILIRQVDSDVNEREIGLDALQKRLGHWGFEQSTRVSGNLLESTYQIVDGFSAAEMLKQHTEAFKDAQGVATLFQCEGRDCGRSVQWANRVFEQRLLYGQDNDQRYWVGESTAGEPVLYVAYSAYRTEGRQYLLLQRYRLSPVAE